MKFNLTKHANCYLLEIIGRIDSYTAPKIEEALISLINLDQVNIVVDLENTTYISSSGILLFVKTQRRFTNMGAGNIIGRFIETPLDLERRNPAMIGGDYSHLGRELSQMMGNRYLPGWGYKTPVDKFWMCGPSCHPGGGVSGGGRAAVQPVMEALGIDFEEVISK